MYNAATRIEHLAYILLGYLIIGIGALCGAYADVGWHVLVVEAVLRGMR